jgi:Flp pilus assembly protein TadD
VPYDGAIAAYRDGRTDEAYELTQAALKADPRNAELRFLRGVLLTERGRTDEALVEFQAMVDDFPELPEPYNNIAFIQASRGQWDQARRALEQSINVVPSYALAHENLGDIYLQLAAQAYARAGRLNPQSTSARRKLATSLDLIDRTQAVPADSPTLPNPRPGAPSQVKPQ